jgi:hypothetical protein
MGGDIQDLLIGLFLLAALVVMDKGLELLPTGLACTQDSSAALVWGIREANNIWERTGKMGEVVLCLLDGVDGDSPLGIYPPFVLGDSGCSDWALLCVKGIISVVGISCMGHEEYTLALLIALEENHRWEDLASLSSFKGSRELRIKNAPLTMMLKARLLIVEKARLTFF